MKVGELGEVEKRTIAALPEKLSPLPQIIFTDVDDTLTHNGLLPVETYSALYALRRAGFIVVPVTGASAGWCDCLIKTWPIENIIGENGALTMIKSERGIVSTQLTKEVSEAKQDLQKLLLLGEELSRIHPAIGFTQDQEFPVSYTHLTLPTKA